MALLSGSSKEEIAVALGDYSSGHNMCKPSRMNIKQIQVNGEKHGVHVGGCITMHGFVLCCISVIMHI